MLFVRVETRANLIRQGIGIGSASDDDDGIEMSYAHVADMLLGKGVRPFEKVRPGATSAATLLPDPRPSSPRARVMRHRACV